VWAARKDETFRISSRYNPVPPMPRDSVDSGMERQEAGGRRQEVLGRRQRTMKVWRGRKVLGFSSLLGQKSET
jgi:hypothetical protein